MDTTVFIAACETYDPETVDKAVRQCLDHFGGAGAFVQAGQKVVLKPNLLMPQNPDKATTTHPTVMAALARAFSETGADTILAESAGGPYSSVTQRLLYRVCGMDPLGDLPGVRLNLDTSSSELSCPDGHSLQSFPAITPVVEADAVVSAAKMKTHGYAYYTGAVKNLFGVMPGLTKAKMHARFSSPSAFNNMLIDICETVQPVLSIVDGVVGMEGAGPSGGDPKKTGVLVASRNPYAADLACAHIMSLDPDRIPMLVHAAKRGLVVRKPEELAWEGADPAAFRTVYKPPTANPPEESNSFFPPWILDWVHKRFGAYPEITDACIGCGKCAEICPASTIEVVDKKAVITYKNCIKCYCCHEICPIQAIRFVSPKRRRKPRD